MMGIAVAMTASIAALVPGAPHDVRYPPAVPVVTVSETWLMPYETFSVSVTGCTPGDDVVFDFQLSSQTVVADPLGDARAFFEAPGVNGGSFNGSVTCDGFAVVFEVNVVETLGPTTTVDSQASSTSTTIAAELPRTNGHTVAVSNRSPRAGAQFRVTFRGCYPGDGVFVDFDGRLRSRTARIDGPTVFTLTAPSTGGRHRGVAECNGVAQGFSVAVQGPTGFAERGDTPAVGSDTTRPGLAIAGMLVLTGIGLLGAARVRRDGPEAAPTTRQ